MDSIRDTNRYRDPAAAAAAKKQPRGSSRSGGGGGSKKSSSRSRRGVNNPASAVPAGFRGNHRDLNEDTNGDAYGQARRSSGGAREERGDHYPASSSAQPKDFPAAVPDASAHSAASTNGRGAGERRVAGSKSSSRRVVSRSENGAVEGAGGASGGVAEGRFGGTGQGHGRVMPQADGDRTVRAEYAREGGADRAILDK